jgi:hypothetical protein
MDASMHTLEDASTELKVELHTDTDWNPWMRIEHSNTKMVLNEDMTIHLSGLSIEEGYAFSDSWDEVGHALREWVNYRTSVDNEGMGENEGDA